MLTRSPPTGIQIAVLLLLVEFLLAVATKYLAPAIGWPSEFFGLLGNMLGFGLAAVLIFGIAPLRRQVMDALSIPIPRALRTEVVLVATVKPAIPFGVMGALAAYYILWAPPQDLHRALGLATDPAAVGHRFYSVYGLIQAIPIGLIVAPFIEELIYRGFLYRAWERQWGWFRAMLATSVVFGAVHPSHVVSAFLGSVVFVCLLRRTGTLWAPICVHAVFNLLVSWPLLGHVLLAKPGELVGRLQTWTVEITCLVVATLGLLAYVWLARRTPEHIPMTVVLAAPVR